MRRTASKPRTASIVPLQPLLFWETGILLFACGILGVRFPLPALVVAGLICLIDSRIRKPAGTLFATCCLGAGFLYGGPTRSVPPPEPPEWLAEALTDSRRGTMRITGTVVGTKGLPDQRLRILLENVQPEHALIPAGPPSPASAATPKNLPLPGLLVWTWEQPLFRPLPGQQVTATLAVRPVRGFRNGGFEGSEAYWSRQGVYFQSWSRGDRPLASVAGQPACGAALREKLRLLVLEAVRPPAPDDTGTKAQNRFTPTSFFRGPEDPAATNFSHGWAVIPALLFGDRFDLRTPDMDRINAAGLGHSLALSGQHLAVVGLVSLFLVGCVGLIRPSVFLLVPAHALTGLLALPPAAFYLWLGDAPPSLIRAALMLLVWCAFRCLPACFPERFSRNRFQLAFPDALLLAFLCMLIMDPGMLYDTGAQLSFCAVAGIALCSPLFAHLWSGSPFHITSLPPANSSLPHRAGNAVLRLLWLTLGCSVAAQLATLPLVLDIFGRTTLWFPLNLLWLPILGFFVLPVSFLGLAALNFGLPEAGAFLLHLVVIPCDLLLNGLVWLQDSAGLDSLWLPRPHWTALPGLAAAGVALALLPGRTRLPAVGKRLLVAGGLLLLIGPLLYLHAQGNRQTTLRVLDVGQAQAILLEWPVQNGRKRALVDGGGFFSDRFDSGRDIIAPLLAHNHPMTLDFIALSHPDRDHLRGLLFIAAHFSPRAVYTAYLPGIDFPSSQGPNGQEPVSHSRHTEDEREKPLIRELLSILAQHDIPRHTPAAGTRIPLSENLWLETLAPPPGVVPAGNNGLVLRLVHKGRGLALLPGDAEAPYLRALLRSGVELSADVLVLPHHGSKGSLVPALLDAVSPRTALVSAGAFNAFRHPAPAVRKALEERGIPLHVTAEEGELVVRWDEEGRLKVFPGSSGSMR